MKVQAIGAVGMFLFLATAASWIAGAVLFDVPARLPDTTLGLVGYWIFKLGFTSYMCWGALFFAWFARKIQRDPTSRSALPRG